MIRTAKFFHFSAMSVVRKIMCLARYYFWEKVPRQPQKALILINFGLLNFESETEQNELHQAKICILGAMNAKTYIFRRAVRHWSRICPNMVSPNLWEDHYRKKCRMVLQLPQLTIRIDLPN